MGNAHGENLAVLNDSINLIPNEIKLQAIETDAPAFYDEIPVLDGNTISHAIRIADKIQDEAHKFWFFSRKSVIQNGLKELNRQNTFSFIGYMITTSSSSSALGDIKRHISYECLKHLLLCFLKQAEDCGLKDSFQFKKLKKEYSIILSAGGTSTKRIVNKKLLNETNMYIENLYMEMSKILH